MRYIFILGICAFAALCLGGLPLIDPATKKPIPNYQIHEDGTISPLQQSGNSFLYPEAESNIRYDRKDLNAIDQLKKAVSTNP